MNGRRRNGHDLNVANAVEGLGIEMSANNQLVIKKEMYDWVVRDQDVDLADEYEGQEVGRSDSLEEAVAIANEYMQDNEVEYGLDIRK